MTDRPAASAKHFTTCEEQVELLKQRGMLIGDHDRAIAALSTINYYRLSGYWYPFRMHRADGDGRSDRFFEGTQLEDVLSLYDFDMRLRTAIFASLTPIELAFRAQIGHELGRIDPYSHLSPATLGPPAREPRASTPSRKYSAWMASYAEAMSRSREDFVVHHRANYGGRLPVWAAVEILDWGKLTQLFGMAPDSARRSISLSIDLTAPQLESWLKMLNVMRNHAAHHGRIFNRVYTLTPKLPPHPTHPELAGIASVTNRTFGQLTIIQYLLTRLGVGNPRLLPAILTTYPEVAAVPLSHTGAPEDWRRSALWR